MAVFAPEYGYEKRQSPLCWQQIGFQWTFTADSLQAVGEYMATKFFSCLLLDTTQLSNPRRQSKAATIQIQLFPIVKMSGPFSIGLAATADSDRRSTAHERFGSIRSNRPRKPSDTPLLLPQDGPPNLFNIGPIPHIDLPDPIISIPVIKSPRAKYWPKPPRNGARRSCRLPRRSNY
jgi:hypothetical protein